MLPLSANPDFQQNGNLNLPNPYYDINGEITKKSQVYGVEALDQAIEMVLCTEPGERIFNLGFSSPLYSMLFENYTEIDDIMQQIFDQIEFWVPITIIRNEAEIEKQEWEHLISFKIPYVSNNGMYKHVFNRVIGR